MIAALDEIPRNADHLQEMLRAATLSDVPWVRMDDLYGPLYDILASWTWAADVTSFPVDVWEAYRAQIATALALPLSPMEHWIEECAR